MTEQKLNIYEKLQKCRVEIQQKAIKKTGKNNFSNYDYIELKDFLPFINESCERYKLCPIFNFQEDKAALVVFNAENPHERVTFTTPIRIGNLKGCNEMQSIGGTQTYARRYLYFMAFEIVDNDLINQSVEDIEKDAQMEKITPVKVALIEQKIRETGTDKEKFLKWVKVKKVEDITASQFEKCMKAFEGKAKKNAELEKDFNKQMKKEHQQEMNF